MGGQDIEILAKKAVMLIGDSSYSVREIQINGSSFPLSLCFFVNKIDHVSEG